MNERIKALRKELGLSQDVFAEKLGLTKNYISLVENEEYIPCQTLTFSGLRLSAFRLSVFPFRSFIIAPFCLILYDYTITHCITCQHIFSKKFDIV